MTLLSVADFKARVPTNVDEEAIAKELDAAEEAINDRIGPLQAVTERFSGHRRRIVLSRSAESIVSVTERGDAVASSGYRSSGYILERLRSDGWPTSWIDAVVTYNPQQDIAERIRVQTELVQLALNYQPGVVSQSNGPFSESYPGTSVWNFETERASILATLPTPARMAVVE